jgi:hypothetical protein
MNNINKLFFTILVSFIACLSAQSQARIIKGFVQDAQTKEPVPFAGVLILGTTNQTVTDIDGNFTLYSSAPSVRIKVTSVGYKGEVKSFNASQYKSVVIKLSPDNREIEAVVIKAGKRKYKNKDNPAVELINKVIDHKKDNKQQALDYYKNEKYEKILFALSNISPDFKKKKAFKKFQFVFENTDTTKIKGKEVLPIYMKENLSDYYFRRSPKSDKEIVKANKVVSFDGYFDDQGIAEYLKYMYQDINIYNNTVTFLTNQFLSPIAGSAPTFYRYYIMDTVKVENKPCVRMFFSPRNKTDMLFQGYMFVTLDSTFAVKKIDMSVNKDINLNWVKDVKITQQFDKTPEKGWVLSDDEIAIDFGLSQNGMGVYGQRAVTYRNFNFNPIADNQFKGDEVEILDSAGRHDNSYWLTHRHVPLSKSESGTYLVMDSVKNVPAFKRAMDIFTLLLFGYKDMGYFEIGPVNTFYSYNPIEGVRLRFGGRTTPLFSKKLNLETYAAYGFKDEKYKYYLGVTWSLTKKTIWDFPVKYIKVSYQDETKIPGQDLQFVQEDNILLSIKRGVNDKLFYNKTFKLEHLNEFRNHFSYDVSYQFNQQRPAGNLYFNYTDYLLHTNDVTHLNISEFSVDLRYAPHEQFYQNKLYRVPIANEYPIIDFRYTAGAKFFGNDYNYQKLQLSIYKRFNFSILGYTDVTLEGGKIFGRVPYPLLAIHRANQTYSYQILSYNMMNFLEFVSDQYTSLNIDHCFNGFFINKIPLINKLKLREVVTCKILYGGVSNTNNPKYHNDLFKFPVEDDGTPITYTLEKKPYIEASAGLGNIFKFFRIDVVKRLTYLDHPHVASTGIRARFKFDF